MMMIMIIVGDRERVSSEKRNYKEEEYCADTVGGLEGKRSWDKEIKEERVWSWEGE